MSPPNGFPDAGRELDALVADRVMGLEWRAGKMYCRGEGWYPKDAPDCNRREKWDHAIDPEGYRSELPMYSEDIRAAWEVVEKLRGTWDVSLTEWAEGWCCLLDAETPGEIWAQAETAPHAICLAALKAVGVGGDLSAP